MKISEINFNNVLLGHVAGAPVQHKKSGLPQIAFTGRSNVGKSSLINSLLNRKSLARVSSQPGKTITCNYYEIDRKLYFVDLPGYGFAKRPKEDKKRWSALTQSYFEDNSALKLILQLVDSRVGFTVDDNAMLEWMNYYEVPYIIICTKCDKLTKTELSECAGKIVQNPLLRPETPVVLYSSKEGMGRREVLGMALAHC